MKRPSFERIIGGTPEEREALRKDAETESEKSGEELFGEFLVEPTPEEKYAIEKAVEYAAATAKKYGSSRTFDPKRIFILKPHSIFKITEGKGARGFFDPKYQIIALDRIEAKARLSATVVHELLHALSYQALQIIGHHQSTSYRSGIAMTGRNAELEYFEIAQEGIIAKLSRGYFDTVIAKDSLYVKDIERTEYIKQWMTSLIQEKVTKEEDRQKLLSWIHNILIIPRSESLYNVILDPSKDDKYKYDYFSGFYDGVSESTHLEHEREEERKKFDEVLDRIVDASEDKITRDELFDEFARAHFTGNYLPLARTVEGIMGEGSFRRIAKELGEGE